MESIVSFLHSAVSIFLTGFTAILVLLFALSLVTIAIWLYNWPIFVFAGTSIIGLLVACGYAWLCCLWYEPYATWFESFKTHGKPAVSQPYAMPVY